MKEIYLLQHGEGLSKVCFKYQNKTNLKINDEKLFDYNYVELTSGEDDIYIVNNYNPNILYIMGKNDSLIEIMSRGYDVGDINEIDAGDKIIICKPKNIRHVVKPLETLDEISFKYSVNKQEIFKTNKLKTEKLFVGQVLWI